MKQVVIRYRRYEANVSELPRKRYGLFSGIKSFLTEMPEKTNKLSKGFWSSLVCLNHLPYDNDLSRELRDCFERGGLTAVRFCRKYNIRPRESFFTTANMYFNLLTCAYKRSKYFTEEPYISGLGESLERL